MIIYKGAIQQRPYVKKVSVVDQEPTDYLNWSEQEVVSLKEAVSKKIQPAQIKKQMMPYRTRNSIISKIRRLKLIKE